MSPGRTTPKISPVKNQGRAFAAVKVALCRPVVKTVCLVGRLAQFGDSPAELGDSTGLFEGRTGLVGVLLA
jgi:hypothetical protein